MNTPFDINLWTGISGLVLTIIQLIIAGYTLHKVKKVVSAQLEERRITQELLDIDQIEVVLKRVIRRLIQVNDQDSMSLANELSHRLGAIQGTRRAMDRGTRTDICGEVVTVEHGFFSLKHIDDLIDNSSARLHILTGSTRLISGYYQMEKIRHACLRGVEVKIIGIDPEAPDEILTDATRTVSQPAPSTASDYRKIMIENQDLIRTTVGRWTDPNVCQRFQYKAHPSVPRVSLVLCDDYICLGFLQFFRDAQQGTHDDRPYIRIPTNSSLGEIVNRHFDLCWSDARNIIPGSS
jgi:hypothetical protein